MPFDRYVKLQRINTTHTLNQNQCKHLRLCPRKIHCAMHISTRTIPASYVLVAYIHLQFECYEISQFGNISGETENGRRRGSQECDQLVSTVRNTNLERDLNFISMMCILSTILYAMQIMARITMTMEPVAVLYA